MKKTFIILISLITIILSGCDPATFYFEFESMNNEVLSVELVEYDNNSSEMINTNLDSKLIFDSKKIISVETLEEERIDEFLKGLSVIVFHQVEESTIEPVKECLKINKNNGNYIILSCTVIDGTVYSMVAEYDSSGNFLEHLAYFADRPSYERLIDKYFK